MTAHGSESSGPLRLLDGGIGSELRRRGVVLSDNTWSATANLGHADLLTAIHRDYIQAGADIITANTFATNRFVLAAAGLEDRFDEINRAAIDAARRAAEGHEVTLAASVSCLPPEFDVSAYPAPALEYRAYQELADLLAGLGVDLLLIEMLQHRDHAARACRAAAGAGLPFWAGISCRRRPVDGALVAFDAAEEPIAAVIEAVLPFDPAGIAIMHTPADVVAEALTALQSQWHGPLGAYAETPYAEAPGYRNEPELDPDAYAALAGEWRGLGATLLGGCCGTTPEHIARMRETLCG